MKVFHWAPKWHKLSYPDDGEVLCYESPRRTEIPASSLGGVFVDEDTMLCIYVDGEKHWLTLCDLCTAQLVNDLTDQLWALRSPADEDGAIQ